MTSAFSLLNFSIPVTPALLFSLFTLLIAVWLVFTVILRYHWKKYSVNKLTLLEMNLVYLVGSAVLLVLIGISALLYALPS